MCIKSENSNAVQCGYVAVVGSIPSKDELLLENTFIYAQNNIQICNLHIGTLFEIRWVGPANAP